MLPPPGTEAETVHLLGNSSSATGMRWLWRGGKWWFAPRPLSGTTPRAMAKLGWFYEGVAP